MLEKRTVVGIVLALAFAGAAPLYAGSSRPNRSFGDRAQLVARSQNQLIVNDLNVVPSTSIEHLLRLRAHRLMRLARTLGLPLPELEDPIRSDGLSDGPDPIGGKADESPGGASSSGPTEESPTDEPAESGGRATAFQFRTKT